MSSRSRQQLEDYLAEVDVYAKKVVDVGGSQNPIKDRVGSWKVIDYVIVDLIYPHEKNAEVDIYMDVNHRLLSAFPNRNVNVIFCIEVMEYVYDPVQAIQNFSAWMRSGGILYISFHFFYPLHPPTGKDYLRYTKHGAIKLLEENGFEILDYIPRDLSQDGVNVMASLFRSEGFRYDKNVDFKELFETGCIIKAIKK